MADVMDSVGEIRSAITNAPEAVNRISVEQQAKSRLPKGCPVEPLGVQDDQLYYLDSLRQLRVIKADKHSRNAMQAMFGVHTDYLRKEWPRHSKGGDIVGWDAAEVTETLMAEASRRGVLDVVDRVRGAGGWVDDEGRLVMHCGDEIHTGAQIYPAGKIGRHIYPSAPEKPKPGDAGGEDAAKKLLELIATWNWVRPDIDPHLLLGWLGAAMLGGALEWRPMVWVTGDKATGKSTLHKLIQRVIGPGGLILASDATAAGLWQYVGHASLPVALDELEAEEDNRKNSNIIKLARHAASGGVTLRGGSDHKGTDFTVRSAFLFSSILIPPMLGQDISRMAVLQLEPLAAGRAPTLDPRLLAEFGAVFRRRLLTHWPRFTQLLQLWHDALANKGHAGRSADQFGTLLACRDLLLSDYMPSSDYLEEWAELLRRDTLSEAEDDISDHERCIQYLLSYTMDVFRQGERRQVGSWIYQAAYGKEQLDGSTGEHEANKMLASVGIKVGRENNLLILYVANAHQGLQTIFRETHWGGRGGSTGVWVQAMRRVPGALPGGCIRFDGVAARCTKIPLAHIMEKEGASCAP